MTPTIHVRLKKSELPNTWEFSNNVYFILRRFDRLFLCFSNNNILDEAIS